MNDQPERPMTDPAPANITADQPGTVPREVRRLVHAVDQADGEWVGSSMSRWLELWREVRDACAAVRDWQAGQDRAAGDAPACGEECAEGHVYAGRCAQVTPVFTGSRENPDGQPDNARTTPDNPAASTLPCSLHALKQPHPAHDWEPQPGMKPVHCFGVQAASDDGLREQLVAAIKSVRIHPALDPIVTSMIQAGSGFHITDEEAGPVADAVLAVRDRRMEQLTAGRATWKAKAQEIEADRDRLLRESPWLRASDEDRQTAEATIARVRAVQPYTARTHGDRSEGYRNGWNAARAESLAALDAPNPAEMADGHGHATVTTHITAPDQANADQWAATIRDFVHAEHGEHMQLHITINPEEQQ